MKCETCGGRFVPIVRADRQKPQRFCSKECRVHRPSHMPTCQQCGQRPARQGRKYCSQECYGLARSGDLTARFWENVTKNDDGCWLWTGASVNGYGIIQHQNKSRMATHVSWALAGHGDVPRGFVLCHRCDNPPCVRPDHLFKGTKGDNNSDAYAKGRHTIQKYRADHPSCSKGHPFDAENTGRRRDDGSRFCKTCNRDRARRHHLQRLRSAAVKGTDSRPPSR